MKDKLSDAEIAESLGMTLEERVRVLQERNDAMVARLMEAMRIDKVRADRIDFAIDVGVNILAAASYSLPGGPAVGSALMLLRGRSLTAAWQLARTRDTAFLGVNDVHQQANLYDAEGNVVGRVDANTPRDGTALSSGTRGELMRKQLEGDVVGALPSSLGPGGGPSAALERIGVSESQIRASVSDSSGGRDALFEAFKRVIAQLDELDGGGEEALLPFALAALVENVEWDSKGLNIVNLGGYRYVKDGKPRLALGDAEVDEALKDKQLNRLQEGWRARTWIWDPKIIDAQRRMDPYGRAEYEDLGWTADDIDRLLLFKAKVTTYRHEIESALADLKIGSVTKLAVKDIAGDSPMLKSGFGEQWHKYVTGRHGVVRGLVYGLTFGTAWQHTNQGLKRATLILDCYIVYKILELHLGTPWLAALPYSDRNKKAVGRALVDAYITVVWSKAVGPKHRSWSSLGTKSKKHGGSLVFAGDIRPHEGILGSPTISAYFSPTARFLATAPGAIARDGANAWLTRETRTSAAEVAALSERKWHKFAITIPNFSDDAGTRKKRDYSPTRLTTAQSKYARRYTATGDHFVAWKNQISDRYARLFATGSFASHLDALLASQQRLHSLMPGSWTTDDEDGNRLRGYLTWARGRRGGFSGRTLLHYERLGGRLEAMLEGNPVMASYLAQEAALDLHLDGVEKIDIVLELMHETLRELVKAQSPRDYATYQGAKGTFDRGSLARAKSGLKTFTPPLVRQKTHYRQLPGLPPRKD